MAMWNLLVGSVYTYTFYQSCHIASCAMYLIEETQTLEILLHVGAPIFNLRIHDYLQIYTHHIIIAVHHPSHLSNRHRSTRELPTHHSSHGQWQYTQCF